jgi:hypothetical protein
MGGRGETQNMGECGRRTEGKGASRNLDKLNGAQRPGHWPDEQTKAEAVEPVFEKKTSRALRGRSFLADFEAVVLCGARGGRIGLAKFTNFDRSLQAIFTTFPYIGLNHVLSRRRHLV